MIVTWWTLQYRDAGKIVPQILAESMSFHHSKNDDDQRHACKSHQYLWNEFKRGVLVELEWAAIGFISKNKLNKKINNGTLSAPFIISDVMFDCQTTTDFDILQADRQ